ncbi:MAG TPA: hypothetical protein DCS07_04020 [Bdellovibrionales bacterium]|nr:MAG: hypothetical protein A2Z97_11825 [Bdellovibrionales bacterium GWB1_52_6]OFZ05350.1 MAG: hypothetical protein A2X97_16530 [Bdellovibrionales bacterium GWA1_52_35]OFZ43314.1 MAG: hypothetical protein A2070_02790 [Bdellovibrionales bacterium GWC1_52_8]HAR41784.1 hypothetical protein [Bdellovibrionales bacterium]HCM39007.1 hypothetical protein [Bdellovibrionales bacterium]
MVSSYRVLLGVGAFFFITALGSAALGAAVPAREVGFSEIWSRIQDSSPVLRAAKEDLQASRVAEQRAKFHWFPSIGLEARAYNTDDAGDVLFSKIGARGITGQDFSPMTMNFPVQQNFARISLGLDWKVYEGGTKRAVSQARTFWKEASEIRHSAELQKICGAATQLYSGLLTLREEELALSPVGQILQRTTDRYRIGSKANPLGYSGLLGLQSLENRLKGELISIKAKKKSLLAALNEMSGIGTSWMPPAKLSSEKFANSVFRSPDSKGGSASVVAAERGAMGLHSLADAERARFLPQVGLFSQGNFAQSSSSSATSMAAGAYLRWELFNPSNWLAVKEARARALSTEAQAQALREHQRSNAVRWTESLAAISEQIALAEESLQLMQQQTTIALQLFQNGVLNALQLTEVLSRRVELVIARSQMNEEKIKVQAEILTHLSDSETGAVCN